jgi:hypothetical protein
MAEPSRFDLVVAYRRNVDRPPGLSRHGCCNRGDPTRNARSDRSVGILPDDHKGRASLTILEMAALVGLAHGVESVAQVTRWKDWKLRDAKGDD